MPWQLRATAGPLEGAVYVLRRRVTLGRAGDCDIQIINDGVSRRHAKVVAEGERYVLIDLSSNNGTYVGDERVQRHVLGPGDELRIMRTRFVFEPVPTDEDDGDSDVWAVKITNGLTLRQTVDHLSIPERPPRAGTPRTISRPGPPRAPSPAPASATASRPCAPMAGPIPAIWWATSWCSATSSSA